MKMSYLSVLLRIKGHITRNFFKSLWWIGNKYTSFFVKTFWENKKYTKVFDFQK